jgi:hypothetical protein
MRRASGLATIVLLIGLAGCGSPDDGSSPSADSPSASAPASPTASPTASATAGSSDGESDGESDSPTDDPTGSTPGGADASASAGPAQQLLTDALTPVLSLPVVDFRYDVYSGPALAIETKGRAFQQRGWQATTISPKKLDSPDAPSGDEVKGALQVRAVGAGLFMQLSTWSPPLQGCWLRTGKGQVPGGQLAMTPGVPGYITLLGVLQPDVVVSQDGSRTILGADVPLRAGLQLLTTGVLGLVSLDASQLDGASMPLGVRLTDGVLTDVELQGPDLVSAIRAAGGDVAPDAEATLSQLRIDVAYKAGPVDAPVVTPPADALVMTNAEVKAGSGCR